MITLNSIAMIGSFLLIILESNINAFTSRPSHSLFDGSSCYRKSMVACSTTNEQARLLDNSPQIQDVAETGKSSNQNHNQKVYSFQRGSGTTSTSLWESKLRKSIVTKQFDEAFALLRTLNSTRLASGRDVVYVITETCRKSQNMRTIIPLLSSMVKLPDKFDYTTEDDIMPLLVDCSKTKSISSGYRIISWLHEKKVKFSAKTYSVLLKGYGLQQNEQMVDRILLECLKFSVKPDLILFNSAIDAYIRCNNPQKAIDFFDAVVGDTTDINNDKRSYSSNEKNTILEVSRAFVNKNLKPNIRTYNTVLKALRGYSSFDKCMDVIRMMKKNHVAPDSVTMNTLVDAASLSGNLEIAEDLIRHPMATPGVEAYTAIITGYSAGGYVVEAFRILNFMMAQSIQPNSYTLTALMKTCVKKEDWSRARELLIIGHSHLAAPATSTAQPNQAADGSGMRLLATSSQYLIMKDISVLHGSYVIGLCTLAVSSEDPDDREMYLKEAQYELITMEEKNLKPDTATMNAFIQALCAMTPARVTDALLILRAMKIEDIGPDDYTYSILFTALGKEGYIDEALQLFRSTDKVMDTPALNALLRAFIGGPNPLHAVQIYQELVFANSSIIEQSQFLPSKYTFTILYLAISRSISPQKFSTPSQRKSYGYFDDGGREVTGKDRKTKLKPMRFLSTLRGATGESYEPVKTASGDVVVDTTIRNVSPPQRALSVLGEVVKSIGVKLNAKKNSQAAASPYSVTGVHGNYVKSTYEEVKPPPQAFEEPEKSLSMAYDESSGRFYESSREKKTRALFDKNIDGTGSTSDLRKVKERQAYTADDLMEDDMNRNPKYDKYGPPDNLDILRETYFKNQEAKSRSASKIPTALKTSGMDAYGEESLRDSKNVDLVNLNADNLLQKLFLSMRFDYNIEADEIMISALNSLFTTTNQFESSRNSANGIGSVSGSGSGNEISDKNDLAAAYNVKNNYKPSTPTAVTLGWAKKSGLSKKTAELVFADLVISGWHPSMFQPILYSCGYPQRQVIELLRKEEDNTAIKKIRASSASIRIFKKHDWNNVESGWSGFF